jgi:hypothetical protein
MVNPNEIAIVIAIVEAATVDSPESDYSRNVAMSSQIPREILRLPASEKFMFSEAGALLLDSQMPSPPQRSTGNFFFALDGRFDHIGVWP